MTESDWLISTDPQAMLGFLRDRGLVSERKLRLYACTCARRVWHHLTDDRFRQMVETAERYADGLVSEVERTAVRDAGWAATARWRDGAADAFSRRTWLTRHSYAMAATVLLDDSELAYRVSDGVSEAVCAERLDHCMAMGIDQIPGDGSLVLFKRLLSAYCGPLRDIFGYPFAPITFSHEWRTEAVVSLTRGIYEERAWDRMSVLADALEEVGADPELVRHCREPGTHVRGCHVLDAALDRA